MVSPKTLNIPVQLAIIQLLAIRSLPPLIDVWVAASVFSVMVPVPPGHPVFHRNLQHMLDVEGSKLLSIILLTQTYLPSLVPPSHSLLILVVLAIMPLLLYPSSTDNLPCTNSITIRLKILNAAVGQDGSSGRSITRSTVSLLLSLPIKKDY